MQTNSFRSTILRRIILFCITCVPVLVYGQNLRPIWNEVDTFDVELNKVGFEDLSGRIIIQPQFDFTLGFAEGLAAVSINGKWGYINEFGKFVIKPQFDDCKSFNKYGQAKVVVGGKVGIIDKTGRYLLKPLYDDCLGISSNGFAAIMVDGLWGYMDLSGKFVIQPQYMDCDTFDEYGLAPVKTLDNECGYIDTSGNFVIKLKADYCSPFNEKGLALVIADDKWGCIDRSGAYVFEPRFDNFTQFDNDGIAEARLEDGGEAGYMDQLGNFYTNRDAALYLSTNGESFLEFIDRMVLPWEKFLSDKQIVSPTAPSPENIKHIVEKEVGVWQQKGEFESTAEWQQRVNEKTRKEKIAEITQRFQTAYNQECKLYATKFAEAKREYAARYRVASDIYCTAKARDFAQQIFTLNPYDADNETFLISSNSFGDILLPVPKANAPLFKADWSTIKKNITAVFVPIGNDVALKSITFGDYTYDGNTKANYAVTNIDYNFAPIEMSNLDLAMSEYDFDQISSAPTVATISNPNAKTISATKVKPESRTLAVGSASDVDHNIPQSKATAKNTFAIVIANENYKNVESVENAANDGKIVAQYLTTTLGIPQKQVFAYTNASYGEMVDALDKMQNIAKAYSGTNYNVIFYYAGHGVPDEQSHEAYLLPIDGKPGNSAVNISLSKLYSTLGNLGASSVYVMLDACFSGSQRGDGMLAQARGVAIKAKAAEPQGNMIVLSAAQGDETAYPYQGKSHGLFTYYLLKKLQESSGNVTIGELSDYIIENVRKTSVLENNGKLQTPTVRASLSSGESWRNNKLVK
jgi:hypothetical protein